MTREEYIKQEAMRYADNPDMSVLESITAEHSFYDGAVYADQHPRKGLWDAEKVIMWLRANIDNYANYNIKTDECFVDDFEEDLKKAMEAEL